MPVDAPVPAYIAGLAMDIYFLDGMLANASDDNARLDIRQSRDRTYGSGNPYADLAPVLDAVRAIAQPSQLPPPGKVDDPEKFRRLLVAMYHRSTPPAPSAVDFDLRSWTGRLSESQEQALRAAFALRSRQGAGIRYNNDNAVAAFLGNAPISYDNAKVALEEVGLGAVILSEPLFSCLAMHLKFGMPEHTLSAGSALHGTMLYACAVHNRAHQPQLCVLELPEFQKLAVALIQRARRERPIAKFCRTAWCIGAVSCAWSRARERLHAPGGAGFLLAKAEFEGCLQEAQLAAESPAEDIS